MTMSTVNTINQAPQSMQAQSPQKSLGQKDFLRLMVAQIQNQDPMQPQANGEFLAQLAQFSTNDGIMKMQNSLQELASGLQSNQALQASALVGRTVYIDNNKMTLDDTGETKAAIDMVGGLTNLTAYIYGESGELVKTMPLGQPQPGFFQFSWDGNGNDGNRMPAGKYKIEVHGTYAGQEVMATTMTTANVDSVSLGQNGEGLRLNVSGIGSISLAEVRQITV